MNKNLLLILVFMMCLVMSGCGLGPNGGKPTPTQAVYQPTRSVATLPPPTAAPACNNVLAYTQYEDLFLDMRVEPGQKFTAEWEVMNYSDCIWDERYHLFFISGNQMGAPDFVTIPRVPIGSRTKIAVELTAPEELGEYHSEWKMFGDDNRFFGESLVVDVVVAEPETY